MAQSPQNDFMAVGRIMAPHGIHGEIKVEVLTDFPKRFAPGARVWLEGSEHAREVMAVRPNKDFLLVKLEGYGSRDDVESLPRPPFAYSSGACRRS